MKNEKIKSFSFGRHGNSIFINLRLTIFLINFYQLCALILVYNYIENLSLLYSKKKVLMTGKYCGDGKKLNCIIMQTM